MTDAFQPIDHGPRANESAFGAFDPTPAGMSTRAAGDAARLLHAALPFVLRVADSEADLARVQALRVRAYGHHLPGLAEVFGQPDPFDRSRDVTLFYAQDKASGEFVGAARFQTNVHGPLQIERSLELPASCQGRLLAEVTRLVVRPGYIPPVKLALVKAMHLFCIANQIGGVVAAARHSITRQYLHLGFNDLYGDMRLVPMAHGSGMAHRVLFRDTVTSEADARARGHPDYAFVFRTYHPDIQIFQPVLSQSHRGLASDAEHAAYSSKAA